MEQALVGKQVRWPMTVAVLLKHGAVAVEGALYPESGLPESPGGESHTLLVGSPSATVMHGFEVPMKGPEDWLQAVRPKSRVLVVGTVRRVQREDWSQTRIVAGAEKKWTLRRWTIDVSPGWAEPLPADK